MRLIQHPNGFQFDHQRVLDQQVMTEISRHQVAQSLFITVLAYQLVQAIRRKLELAGDPVSWTRLREILSVQQRVTATFRQRDGRTQHVRNPPPPNPPCAGFTMRWTLMRGREGFRNSPFESHMTRS